VDDFGIKQRISNLVTLLIGYLSGHLRSPNDDIASTFEVRPEELQMLLQVARHVNPVNIVSGPFFRAVRGHGGAGRYPGPQLVLQIQIWTKLKGCR
jgi:hypothetical protein